MDLTLPSRSYLLIYARPASQDVTPVLLPFIPIRMRPALGLFIQAFALTGLYCPNLVPLLLVGWQSPLYKLTIASEYFAGMKPLATFRAAINSISIRNKILLITPVVHILSHGKRSALG